LIIDESKIAVNVRGHADNHNARKRYVISEGTTVIDEPLEFPDDSAVIGAGIGRSMIDATAVDGVAIFAPGGQSIMDGFTVLGNGNPGTVGIQSDNDHRLYNANWGKVCVRNFAIGINMVVTLRGAYFNQFDVLRTQACDIGLNLDGEISRFFYSASNIGAHFADNCGVALRINGPSRITIGSIQYEICGTAVQAVTGGPLNIAGGGIEGDNDNLDSIDFDIGDSFGGLTYLGSTDVYNRVLNDSPNRSTIILPSRTRAQTLETYGRIIMNSSYYGSGMGPVVAAPNDTRYILGVDNNGNVTATVTQ